eukprot:11163450-Lingulodinium_polyedra.AAC.1
MSTRTIRPWSPSLRLSHAKELAELDKTAGFAMQTQTSLAAHAASNSSYDLSRQGRPTGKRPVML